MKKDIKKIMLTLMMLCMGVVSVGCSGGTDVKSDQAANTNKSSANQVDSLKIGVLRTIDSLPIYMADEKNYFTENGVKVELVEFGSASDQSKAIESGAIDGMMTDMVVQHLLQKGGTDMRTVTTSLGATKADGKFLVVASEDSGVGDIGDVKGKTVAISENTMMEYLVDSYMSELNIDINDIEKVNIPSLSLRLETLLANKVDMAILPDPMGDLSLTKGCKSIINDTELDNNYSSTVIAFRKEVIDSKPDAVASFVKGFNQAIDRINEKNPDDMDFIYSVSNVPEELQASWVVPTFTKNVVPSEDDTSSIGRWLVGKGLIEEEYSYDQIVDSSFIKEN